ncbi:MAG: hypothetical protein ACRBFS_07485 [Aureispira sp.]
MIMLLRHRLQVYGILFFFFSCALACSPEEVEITPLSFNELEGYWVADTWQSSTLSSTLVPLTIQFTRVNRSGVFQDVPTNSWGYQEDEIVFRALESDVSRDFSMIGQVLIKEENSNQEAWMPVHLTYLNGSEELYLEVDCISCPNNVFTLRRQ